MLYLSEERRLHGILPLLGVRENVGVSIFDRTLNALGVISRNKERTAVERLVADYAVKTASIDKQIMYLSGGNQQKVIIGRAMSGQPTILIFDEPTKGIDVKSRCGRKRMQQTPKCFHLFSQIDLVGCNPPR